MRLKEVISFLTFSLVTENSAIEKRFNTHHSNYQSRFPYWSTTATRRKLISDFWYSDVFKHFTTFAFIGLITVFTVHPYNWFSSIALLITGCTLFVLFMVMLIGIYIPTFSISYLPLLDNYVEYYTGKQLESIQKCKKQQLSVKALLLIQYVLQKIAGLKETPMDEAYINLLVKQYGISKQMIDNAYKEIFVGKWDAKAGRKYTEMVQSFEEVEEYFNLLKADNAFPVLYDLKEKVLRKAKRETTKLKTT